MQDLTVPFTFFTVINIHTVFHTYIVKMLEKYFDLGQIVRKNYWLKGKYSKNIELGKVLRKPEMLQFTKKLIFK